MRNTFITICLTLLFASIATAGDFTFKFTWDPNTESSMAGYAIFERINGAAYDYAKPLDPDCTIVDGKCYTDSTNLLNSFSLVRSVNIPAVSGLTAVFNSTSGTVDFAWVYTPTPSITYSYVARARNIDGLWSENSNEVSKTIDLSVTNWKLYMADNSGGPYAEVASIPWDGSATTISSSFPADTLAPGEDYFFTVVAFTTSGVYSPNSAEVKIDRRPPTKVINLKITLE